MHRRLFARPLARTVALAILVGAAATAGSPAPANALVDDATAALAATLDGILADAKLAGAQAAVVVADAGTGEQLYNRNGARRLVPASNTKLITSAAALDILGGDYRFATDVRTTGNRRGPMLLGDLYLRGTGDPTMLAADYDALAARISASGIRLVRGALVADDTAFDAQRLGTDWAWDDEGAYYAAPVSALTVAPDADYDAGNVIVTVTPAATAGEAPAVTLTPATGAVTIDNRAGTVAAGGTDTVSVARTHGTNRIVITGNAPVGGARTQEWVSVPEPTAYAADVFRRALAKHGVGVVGGTRLGAATPADATTVAEHRSMTLAELMIPFLKLSNNGHAEALVKAIGRAVANRGSWPAGLAAIKAFAGRMGMDTAAQRQADGSGLSRFNLIPPAEFVDLLAAARGKPWYNTWYDALPIAGNADRFVGGTLRSRMAGTRAANNVHAKTGSMTSVSALSGYVTDADGRPLVFAILLNNHLAGSVRDVEDRIAVALASFTRTPAAAARSAVPTVPAVPATPGELECSWVKPIAC
jgi:D-alanyl-D-alanine carboxypeptidase/D-alanyl-D-alanine-endopeptidase (penicillin-binding protein 4)